MFKLVTPCIDYLESYKQAYFEIRNFETDRFLFNVEKVDVLKRVEELKLGINIPPHYVKSTVL